MAVGGLRLDPRVATETGFFTHSSNPGLLMAQLTAAPPCFRQESSLILAQGDDCMHAVTSVTRESINWMWVSSVGKEVEC